MIIMTMATMAKDDNNNDNDDNQVPDSNDQGRLHSGWRGACHLSGLHHDDYDGDDDDDDDEDYDEDYEDSDADDGVVVSGDALG